MEWPSSSQYVNTIRIRPVDAENASAERKISPGKDWSNAPSFQLGKLQSFKWTGDEVVEIVYIINSSYSHRSSNCICWRARHLTFDSSQCKFRSKRVSVVFLLAFYSHSQPRIFQRQSFTSVRLGILFIILTRPIITIGKLKPDSRVGTQ